MNNTNVSGSNISLFNDEVENNSTMSKAADEQSGSEPSNNVGNGEDNSEDKNDENTDDQENENTYDEENQDNGDEVNEENNTNQ